MPQLPQIILILILIAALGWHIIGLLILRRFVRYIEKTNALIEKLYTELMKSDKQNEWLQQELTLGDQTLPEMDIDQIY